MGIGGVHSSTEEQFSPTNQTQFKFMKKILILATVIISGIAIGNLQAEEGDKGGKGKGKGKG